MYELWLGRPLCLVCRSSDAKQLVRVDSLCRTMGVDPRCCRTDMIKNTPQIRGHNVVFWGDGVRRLTDLRSQRRDHLAKVLKHDEVLEEIMAVDLKDPITVTLSERGKQLSKYFLELKSKGWLAKRTRPLCAYPQVARYSGAGSTDDAANFSCVAPK